MDVFYDPRCGIYLNGKSYYISYYLPNGNRVCRTLGSKNRKVAKRLMHQKEGCLLNGEFDERDIKKMPELRTLNGPRLRINEAAQEYLYATSAGRKPKTQINDSYSLLSLVSRFQKEFVDEIRLYDIQILITELHEEGKAQASLKTYLGILKKFFGWLEESGLAEIKNPVKGKVIIPNSSGLVRDRLPSFEEVAVLISDECAIQPLVRFLAFTGCRVGEALHMEWQDVIDGVWMIQRKPNCPTAFGLGWSPKWDKSRQVPLIKEALEVFVSQPRISRWVFPKTNGTRRGSLKRSWGSMKERNRIVDFQLKDFRTWFNHLLKSYFGFSSKEAASYIGNSPRINEVHYDPVSIELVSRKVKDGAATKLLQDETNRIGIAA